MGQKVHPTGFRLGFTTGWPSAWFASKKKYRDYFLQDVRIREYLTKKIGDAGISSIEIERNKKTSVVIYSSKPGVIIGKQGAQIEELRKQLEKTFGGTFDVNVREVRAPDTDAACVAENIQQQIQRRMPYRRASKMAMEKAMQAGAVGVKIKIAGRLNGADIARSEIFKEGNIPLQTLRANVQFAVRHASTTYGTIGVKVWIYKGMVFKKMQEVQSSSIKLS